MNRGHSLTSNGLRLLGGIAQRAVAAEALVKKMRRAFRADRNERLAMQDAGARLL